MIDVGWEMVTQYRIGACIAAGLVEKVYELKAQFVASMGVSECLGEMPGIAVSYGCAVWLMQRKQSPANNAPALNYTNGIVGLQGYVERRASMLQFLGIKKL